jgi:bifunctional non-homologous end joining protein LigD
MLRPSASTRRPAEPGRLQRYRAKRSAEKTPEPFGSAQGKREQPAGARPGLGRAFVIQKHAARRLHYDFRLELGGTLRSWAVPHGPSLDPAQKRLAVEVEDHPVEYADFEGVIPADNYGAGEVIVWDRGRWVALEDPEEGLRKGKLLFQLHGYKLHGEWTLVRTKRGRNSPSQGKQTEWLLIKHADGWASADGDARVPQESILSGRTLEELQAGRSRADEVRSELARLGAPRKRLRAEDVELMLAETVDKAFSRPGWLFELKYDGFRVLSSREGGAPKILYRRGSDATAAFPDVAVALKTLPVDVVLDGELVVLDPAARPSFQLLQSRVQLRRAPDIERAAVELPATIYVFDLLGFEEFDLRTLPLRERKRLLSMLLPRAGPLRYSDHVKG